MNNQQRNELCHCGSGKKYKNCCMRKDEAQAQLAQQVYDVRREIRPNTTPYMFWKTWSAACRKQAFSLVRDLCLDGSDIRAKLDASENTFVTTQKDLGLPFESDWTLDKIKLTESKCLFLCHYNDEDKNADNIVSLVSLVRTNAGLRVDDVRKVIRPASPDFMLSFDLFGIPSAEHDYLVKCKSGWTRPDLTDEATRFVAPEE